MTADFNGDGRLDLATGNLRSGDISILLGRGDGTFQDQLTNPVGNGPQDAVTADLNDDGHTDIITTNYYSNDISVLLGNGDGTFQAARSFPAGEHPSALAVADFNGDGRLDVAVADSGDNGNGQGLSILMGNGDGTFQAPIFYPEGAAPSLIVAGDWTGNGVIDLAVANAGSDNVTVLLGNGRGGFQALPPIPLGDQAGDPVAITAGDFTGNGVLDLAVVDQSTDGVSILEGNGQGGFVALPPISLGDDPLNLPNAIVAGDFTGNGILDLAVASVSLDAPDNVSILLGKGNGKFALQPTTISLGTSFTPSSITTGNFFGGGPLDLAVADSTAHSVSLLQGDGQGGFPFLSELELGSEINPSVVATGDFTGDGRTDLAIASQSPNSVVIELNQGNGQFAQPGSVGLVLHNTPLVADLNGDGVPDVSIVDGAGNILYRQGIPRKPGSFKPPVTVNPGTPSRDIVWVPDTNQGPVLASVDANDNAISLYAYRDGRFVKIGSLATGFLPAQIIAADLNSDGWADLVVRNAGDGTLSVFLNNKMGSFQAGLLPFLGPVTLLAGIGVSDVEAVDTTGNGRLDLVVTNKLTGQVSILQNLGNGTFGPLEPYRAGTGLSAIDTSSGSPVVTSEEATAGVAAGPLTPGGPTDLVTINPGSNTLDILDGLGGGRFANPVDIPTAEPAQVVRVADFNHDGIPDVAVLGNDTVSIYLGNGQGGFLPHPFTINAGLDPTGLTVAYLNGPENPPDLLIGNEYGDVLVLAGQGNGTFRPLTAAGNVALAVADLTGNGTKDIIISDQGLNRLVIEFGGGQREILGDSSSGLLAPGAVAVAYLNGGENPPDLIVANSGSNNVLVYPGNSDGTFGQAVNGGHGFFAGTNPAGISVADVNGDGRPDLVVANKGSNDVSILLNQSQGNSFTFTPGPRLKAGSGPVSTVVQDVNGDGKPDILVSNSLSNNVMLLPGVGFGFFNDQNPTVIPMTSPGSMYPFNVGGRLGVVVLNPESNTVTFISDFTGTSPLTRTFGSGGLDPVAAHRIPLR